MAFAEPAHVALLTGFANTFDVENDVDAIARRSQLVGWLVEGELLTRRTSASDDDLALARRLRDGLRDALASHHEARPTCRTLEAVVAELPLRLSCRVEPPRLRPVDDGVRGALAEIVVAMNDAVNDGSWQRLKLCLAGDCAVAFYDASKNRSRSWCSMEVCGNRAKTRTYRARQRAVS